MPSFFNGPPGASGGTPAADNAPPLGGALRGRSPAQLEALTRLLSARAGLTSLLGERKKRPGFFDQVGAVRPSIGFGIEE